ncbi:MAG: hypothetical protein IKD85_06370 [Firmicutes bacterium]|nr:hypothetical protein [Bacillota bacterium]
MASIPVYVFAGFLESGKTRFIKDTIRDPGFTRNEKTLLIACEDGEEEYDKAFLRETNCKLLMIDSQDEFTGSLLVKAARKEQPDRVVIEYNGMWDLRLLERELPYNWELYQIINTINAETYEIYLNNMGSKIMEHAAASELIVFNRCTDELKDYIHTTNIRAMNPRAYIFLEDIYGQAEDFSDNEPLPFDTDGDSIEIQPEHFGRFYVDAMNDPDKYEGKTVQIYAQLHKREEDPPERFAAGRFSMVCCADDIAFLAFFADMEGADQKVVERDYANITATVAKEFVKEFQAEVPVLKVTEFQPAEAPEDDLLYFN